LNFSGDFFLLRSIFPLSVPFLSHEVASPGEKSKLRPLALPSPQSRFLGNELFFPFVALPFGVSLLGVIRTRGPEEKELSSFFGKEVSPFSFHLPSLRDSSGSVSRFFFWMKTPSPDEFFLDPISLMDPA